MSSVGIAVQSETEMEEKMKIIKDLSIEEREEVFVDVARVLEGTAYEAYVEGNRHFAALSANMAQAIRVNADELARDDIQNAERVLLQATAMISQFNAVHPYRMVSKAVH
ncbi:UNVERIFIED_ORG: SHS2 domain-containing protein [Rhizobium sp. SORGH_AS260]|nr:SHS2 domain-containing protein [Rhizobium sp. SORGH_AS_0285]MDP9757162.1 SHS2 domain-containing protein [Rhizobium sp. SORGH_AS_0260]MDR6084099.1 SHS2 domain-containing protein [Agrobacterium sp. SORGH_AS_0440]